MSVPMVGTLTVLQYLLGAANVHLKARLAKNPLPEEPNSLALTDLTECDFPGYAPVVDPVFSAPVINELNYAEAVSTPIIWTAGTIVTPQPITAIYITSNVDGGPDNLLAVQPVATGVTIDEDGQEFVRQVRLMVTDLAV